MFLKLYIGLFEVDRLLLLLNVQYKDIITDILLDLLKIILLLISIAYYTLAERKIMASTQRRLGPNVVGLFGLLQPLADGLKLLSKELLVPTSASTKIFLFAPVLILMLSLISWVVIPMGFDNDLEWDQYTGLTPDLIYDLIDSGVMATLRGYSPGIYMRAMLDQYLLLNRVTTSFANINYTILFILAISSLNVYGIIIAG